MAKQEQSVEQMLDEMETIAEKLESGNCTLEESLTLYERGIALADAAKERLSKMQARIHVISGDKEKVFEGE